MNLNRDDVFSAAKMFPWNLLGLELELLARDRRRGQRRPSDFASREIQAVNLNAVQVDDRTIVYQQVELQRLVGLGVLD